MSERLTQLLAELEYLRALGNYLIGECDRMLQECSLDAQAPPSEPLGSVPDLEN